MNLKQMDANELGMEFERRVAAVEECWGEIEVRFKRIQDEYPTSGHDTFEDVERIVEYGALRADEVAETLVEMTEELEEARQQWQYEDELADLYSYWASERGV